MRLPRKFRMTKIALLPVLVCGIFARPEMLWSQHPQLSPEEAERLIIEKPDPVYPPLAMQARIQGTVKLEIVVSQTGTIESTKVTSGHPLLIGAAVEAVKRRRYKPYTLDGQPTAFITIVEVPFSFGIPKQEYETQQQLRDAYSKEDDRCRDHLGKRQWADAETACKTALELADKLQDDEGIIKFMATSNVGNALFAQRRFQEALPYYTRSFGYAQASFEETDSELGSAYGNLAMVNHALGNLDEARQLYRSAERTFDLAYKKIGSNQLKQSLQQRLKAILQYHALAAEQAGAIAEAEEIRKRVAAIP